MFRKELQLNMFCSWNVKGGCFHMSFLTGRKICHLSLPLVCFLGERDGRILCFRQTANQGPGTHFINHFYSRGWWLLRQQAQIWSLRGPQCITLNRLVTPAQVHFLLNVSLSQSKEMSWEILAIIYQFIHWGCFITTPPHVTHYKKGRWVRKYFCLGTTIPCIRDVKDIFKDFC